MSMVYAKCGRSKLRHLFAADEVYDDNGNEIPHEFIGGDETRCGRTATGAWTPDEALGREDCDSCYRARGLGSRANTARYNFLKDNPDARNRYHY